MNRYQPIPIINVNNKPSYQTTRYPEVPLSDEDIYVYITQGDRFDILAQQYYGDQSLWWIISIANTAIAGTSLPSDLTQDTLRIPQETQIRIPANYVSIINDFKVLKIEEYESYDDIVDVHIYQVVLDITESDLNVKVGWAYQGGKLFNDLPDVTPRQMRQALILSGVSMQMIEDALGALPEPSKSLALTEWEYSIAFKRQNPLVRTVGVMLGWTSDQLDDLWIMAGKL